MEAIEPSMAGEMFTGSVDTLGAHDAYYLEVWGDDPRTPVFEDVVLYRGGKKVVYAGEGLRVVLANEP